MPIALAIEYSDDNDNDDDDDDDDDEDDNKAELGKQVDDAGGKSVCKSTSRRAVDRTE